MNHGIQICLDIEISNNLFQTMGRWWARINFKLNFPDTSLAELPKVFLIGWNIDVSVSFRSDFIGHVLLFKLVYLTDEIVIPTFIPVRHET